MTSAPWRVAILVPALLLLAACAIRPPLLGSPADSGMLVVDGVARFKGIVGGPVETPIVAASVRRPADRVSIKLSAVDGLVVFSNLKPGTYELEALYVKPADTELHLTIPPEQRPRFTVQVVKGHISYIGLVHARAETSLRRIGAEFGMARSAATERSALIRVRGIYPGSKWDGILTRRIAEL
jgi:hypothetical protein